MTTRTDRPTRAEVANLRDLTRLCVQARMLAAWLDGLTGADALHDDGTASKLRHIAHTLDGARTRLVEDGADYLDAAEAFRLAAARMLHDITPTVEGRVHALA